MKYKTVEEVIEFVRDLRAKDTADSLLNICLEFYDNDNLVGVLVRCMYSGYITLTLKNNELRLYLIDGLKVVISVKKLPSI